jgi:hypothetical protein
VGNPDDHDLRRTPFDISFHISRVPAGGRRRRQRGPGGPRIVSCWPGWTSR